MVFSVPLYLFGGICLFMALSVYVIHFINWTTPALITFRVLVVDIVLLTLGICINLKGIKSTKDHSCN